MDRAEQADGEKRVRELLIEPMERMGLARPSTIKAADWPASVAEICARLAYMGPEKLAALADELITQQARLGKDRMPVPAVILDRAAKVQPPADSNSPLITAVFRDRIGREAIAGDWAPELLVAVRRTRRWPSEYTIGEARSAAREAVRQVQLTRERMARGETVSPEQQHMAEARAGAVERCRAISEGRA